LATIVTTTYPDGTQHQETLLPTLSAGIMGRYPHTFCRHHGTVRGHPTPTPPSSRPVLVLRWCRFSIFWCLIRNPKHFSPAQLDEQAELKSEEHPNKRQKTNTKLTLDGKQHQHSHLMAIMPANLYSWCMFMVELPDTDISSPENPVIIIKFILLCAYLFKKTPEAKA
jgi:hypothetical protein